MGFGGHMSANLCENAQVEMVDSHPRAVLIAQVLCEQVVEDVRCRECLLDDVLRHPPIHPQRMGTVANTGEARQDGIRAGRVGMSRPILLARSGDCALICVRQMIPRDDPLHTPEAVSHLDQVPLRAVLAQPS
eukprot:scaffold313438_cov33-Tisochrysis_lutea.AAC.3